MKVAARFKQLMHAMFASVLCIDMKRVDSTRPQVLKTIALFLLMGILTSLLALHSIAAIRDSSTFVKVNYPSLPLEKGVECWCNRSSYDLSQLVFPSIEDSIVFIEESEAYKAIESAQNACQLEMEIDPAIASCTSSDLSILTYFVKVTQLTHADIITNGAFAIVSTPKLLDEEGFAKVLKKAAHKLLSQYQERCDIIFNNTLTLSQSIEDFFPKEFHNNMKLPPLSSSLWYTNATALLSTKFRAKYPSLELKPFRDGIFLNLSHQLTYPEFVKACTTNMCFRQEKITNWEFTIATALLSFGVLYRLVYVMCDKFLNFGPLTVCGWQPSWFIDADVEGIGNQLIAMTETAMEETHLLSTQFSVAGSLRSSYVPTANRYEKEEPSAATITSQEHSKALIANGQKETTSGLGTESLGTLNSTPLHPADHEEIGSKCNTANFSSSSGASTSNHGNKKRKMVDILVVDNVSDPNQLLATSRKASQVAYGHVCTFLLAAVAALVFSFFAYIIMSQQYSNITVPHPSFEAYAAMEKPMCICDSVAPRVIKDMSNYSKVDFQDWCRGDADSGADEYATGSGSYYSKSYDKWLQTQNTTVQKVVNDCLDEYHLCPQRHAKALDRICTIARSQFSMIENQFKDSLFPGIGLEGEAKMNEFLRASAIAGGLFATRGFLEEDTNIGYVLQSTTFAQERHTISYQGPLSSGWEGFCLPQEYAAKHQVDPCVSFPSAFLNATHNKKDPLYNSLFNISYGPVNLFRAFSRCNPQYCTDRVPQPTYTTTEIMLRIISTSFTVLTFVLIMMRPFFTKLKRFDARKMLPVGVTTSPRWNAAVITTAQSLNFFGKRKERTTCSVGRGLTARLLALLFYVALLAIIVLPIFEVTHGNLKVTETRDANDADSVCDAFAIYPQAWNFTPSVNLTVPACALNLAAREARLEEYCRNHQAVCNEKVVGNEQVTKKQFWSFANNRAASYCAVKNLERELSIQLLDSPMLAPASTHSSDDVLYNKASETNFYLAAHTQMMEIEWLCKNWRMIGLYAIESLTDVLQTPGSQFWYNPYYNDVVEETGGNFPQVIPPFLTPVETSFMVPKLSNGENYTKVSQIDWLISPIFNYSYQYSADALNSYKERRAREVCYSLKYSPKTWLEIFEQFVPFINVAFVVGAFLCPIFLFSTKLEPIFDVIGIPFVGLVTETSSIVADGDLDALESDEENEE